MAIKKELFINALQMVEVDESQNIPTAVLFDSMGAHIGHQALERAADATELNENFKLNLGETARERLEPPRFDTGDGKQRSAHEITKTFFEGVLKNLKPWISSRGLQSADRILVAEPLALDRGSEDGAEWLKNYRAKVKAILKPHFEEVDFLPEPFAVFQYYRYGIRHPLLTSKTRHAALVVDFGGGTFDVSVVDTTASGDVSGSGRNSRPLAAASIAVGGAYINMSIAKDLLSKNLDKGIDRNRISRAWDIYREGAHQDLRADLLQFVRNMRNLISQVERAKIHICDTLADWSLDAQYSPGPGMQIAVPKNPFSEKPEEISIRFDATQLRDIFIRRVWNDRLRPALTTAIDRAKDELGGRQVDIVLLSGGSANIRWLTRLVQALLPSAFPDAEILELQGSFQEVVSKGLAIECARRTFNGGTSDFQAVTYNRLCLVLAPDESVPSAPRFRLISENKAPSNLADGTLLESAYLIGQASETPLRWKFRLNSPPKRSLDYYFLKSSLDHEAIASLHNIDHRVISPKSATFDSNLILELKVSPDGTAYPKFVYRQGGLNGDQCSVDGKPFFLDMTYGEKTTLGEAYVGFDFGTSNSSISYVEQQAVRVYTERASDKGWQELNELVNVLPFPAAYHLARFLGSTSEAEIEDRFGVAFESLLFSILALGFIDFRMTAEARKSSIFKQFTKGSAGPIWSVLRSILERKAKQALFLPKLNTLLELRSRSAIDAAISAINDKKHHRASHYTGHREVLSTLGNALNGAMTGWRFGQFEDITKRGFSSKYTGVFRSAHGSHGPFVEIYEYEGSETFSNMEAVLVSPERGEVLRMSPLIFWTSPSENLQQDIALLDSTSEASSNYRLVTGSGAINVGGPSELADLHKMCVELSHGDYSASFPTVSGVKLTLR